MSEEQLEAAENLYDVVPYNAMSYDFTHPRHLEAMATLFEMQPADITRCRVLELGCAAGNNLIPQAVDLPESTFLGIDLSQRQVRQGQEVIESLALENVELRRADVLDVDDSWGEFDYIISHGLFSWIPPQVQHKLLQISSRNLAPGGVAFISYNTYPGWHLAAIVRGLMRYHTAQFDRAEDQITQAMVLLELLADLTNEKQAAGLVLSEELKLLKKTNNPSYLFHDHLEVDNIPVYFHELMEQAEAQGLQYLADAKFSTMLLQNLPEKAQKAFRHLPLVRQEQYMDFVSGRRFRRTLLCHRDVRLNRRVLPEKMKQFHFALAGEVETHDVDIRNEKPGRFTLGDGRLDTNNRLAKAALMYLKEVYPRYVSFQQLYVTALARVGGPGPGGADDPAVSVQTLTDALLLSYTVNLLEIAVHPPRCAGQVNPRPLASPLVRLQAARGNLVTNQLHRTIGLDPLKRRLIRHLDGAHQRSDLIGCVQQAIEAGELTVKDGDRPVKKVSPAALSNIVDQALSGLSESALLIE